MKFCKLITEVDLELLEELVDNGYPVDRIEENGQVYYKTPAMLCQNLKVNDEVRNYSNGLISMSIENVRKKKGLYRTGNLLIDMDSNIIQKGKEKIFIPKASFTIISTLMDVPHKTVTVHIASIRRLLGDEYIKTHKTVGYFWDFDVFKVG